MRQRDDRSDWAHVNLFASGMWHSAKQAAASRYMELLSSTVCRDGGLVEDPSHWGRVGLTCVADESYRCPLSTPAGVGRF